MASVTGLILAGGAGRRVGGEDKGFLSYQKSSLIERQISWLKPQVDRIIISANRNVNQYDAFGYPVVQDFENDKEKRFDGPLQGILKAMAICQSEYLFVQTIDTPELPEKLIDQLIQKINCDVHRIADCYYLKTSQREHFLSMLINKNCKRQLQAFLAQGNRKVSDFHRSVGSIAIDLGIDELLFKNLNLPKDYG